MFFVENAWKTRGNADDFSGKICLFFLHFFLPPKSTIFPHKESPKKQETERVLRLFHNFHSPYYYYNYQINTIHL